jgi:spermidine/putrescine transport system substrate-binding protein
MTPINRRQLGKLAGVGAASLAVLGSRQPVAAPSQIRMLSWKAYGSDHPDTVAAFRAATGITVVHDYFLSETEMLTKLRTNPGAYDVVLVNMTFVQQAAQEKLIQPLDTAKLSRFGDLDPRLRDGHFVKIDSTYWSAPWIWGFTGIMYDTDAVNPPPTSIQALWDPKHAGRVSMRDDSLEMTAIGAIATGQDMNYPADLGKVKAKLMALKPQFKTFWRSSTECEGMFAAKAMDISPMFSGSAGRMRKRNLHVQLYAPQEGAIGWFDTLAIPAASPNPDAGLKFIDYLLSPEFYVQWDIRGGANVPANLQAVKHLADDSYTKVMTSNPEVFKRLIFMAPLTPEQRQSYLDLWQDVKTSYG